MNDVRLNLTEGEKFANNVLGLDRTDVGMTVGAESIDTLIARERANKFNNKVEEFTEQLEKNNSEFEEGRSQIEYDINKAEIKPMFARIIVKPFKQNPFQKMITKGNLIIDAGGYTPHSEFNSTTGKYEEQQQFIVTGYVVETGPEVKYLREGDVIYYRKDTVVPVPFFKENLVSLAENQVIAVVNESLSERFNSIK